MNKSICDNWENLFITCVCCTPDTKLYEVNNNIFVMTEKLLGRYMWADEATETNFLLDIPLAITHYVNTFLGGQGDKSVNIKVLCEHIFGGGPKERFKKKFYHCVETCTILLLVFSKATCSFFPVCNCSCIIRYYFNTG